MKTAADYLRAAANLIGQPGAWTQEQYAQDENGRAVQPKDPNATCFCMLGALERVSDFGSPAAYQAHDKLYDVLPSVTTFNDTPGWTQAEVVAIFHKAAERVAA